MSDSDKKLTAKEARFVELYVLYADVKKAAIEAGFSESMAKSKAYQWVSDSKAKPHVYDAVKKAQAKLSEKTEISQARIMAEYEKIGFADIRKAVKWGRDPAGGAPGDEREPSENDAPNGLNMYPVTLVPSDLIDDDTAAAVQEVSLTQTGVKIKMYDKKAALDSMAKHLGMFDGKSDPNDDSDKSVGDDLRSVARDIAFVLRRAVEQTKA